MENNNGDSSSESDISDPWSIIDRSSCEPEVPGDSTVRDRDSISEEPSDGESLEVIDEEEKRENEYKDAGMETDGISIITESEGNDELEQPLSLAVSKEKKYLHHPNTYLNTRLNVLLAISFAAVTGLGLGHFLGLQEDCPLLNESSTTLLTKLQHDNQLLRYTIEKLLTEKDTASHSVNENQDWKFGAGTKFKNEGILHMQSGIFKDPLGLEINSLQAATTGLQQHTADNINQHEGEVRNVAKQSPIGTVGKVQLSESSECVTPMKCEDKNVAKQLSNGKAGSIPFDMSSEYVILAEREDAHSAVNVPDVETLQKNVVDQTDHADDVTFVQFRDHNGVELNYGENVAEPSILIREHEAVADFPFVMKDERNSAKSSGKDDQVIQPSVQVKNKMSAVPVRDGDAASDHVMNTHSSGGDSIAGSAVDEPLGYEQIQQHEVNRNVDSLHLEMRQEPYDLGESNIEIIKSTLKLLHTHFDDDILSPDTGTVLFSSNALVTELEQSLVLLQDSITQCEVQRGDFCAQFQNRMEVSVSKLKEIAEGLVDDIDDQMYKLLTRIVRKLKKFKGNLQNKWCHLKNKYDCKNDAVYNWLHSSVLLECKENDKQTRRKLNKFSFKESGKLSEKVIRSTSGENEKETGVPDSIIKIPNVREEYDSFKSVNSDTASEADQKNSIHYTWTQTEYQPDSQILQSCINEEHMCDKVIMNHDNLNGQHFEMNTPMTVPKAFEKSMGQEQYMSELYKDWKHDNRGTLKTHFNGKEEDKHVNKYKIVPQSKTCWQTYNGKTDCHKFKSNQQFLHSQKYKNQYVKWGHGDNQWHKKKNWKNLFNDKDKKKYKEQETKHSWHDENKHHKKSVILEQGASWVLVDTSTTKQNNVSGDWILKMANGRAEQRRLEHRSDWLFDRADARRQKRERHHVTGSWYFQRARGREYCRYYPNSGWCKTGTYSGPNYDWLDQNDYANEYSEDGRLHQAPQSSKKFIPRPFAAPGKWMKDSFSYFKNKINYSHR